MTTQILQEILSGCFAVVQKSDLTGKSSPTPDLAQSLLKSFDHQWFLELLQNLF
jgi:hypothetical protein